MKQPRSLFQLAGVVIIERCCNKRATSEVIKHDLQEILPLQLLDHICKHVVLFIQRAREGAAGAIRQHFLYFDAEAQHYTGDKGKKICQGCDDMAQIRRLKCAPPKLQELIESQLLALQMAETLLCQGRVVPEEHKFDVLVRIAERAAHKWVEHETDLEVCRRRVRRRNDKLLYDPFDHKLKYAYEYGK